MCVLHVPENIILFDPSRNTHQGVSHACKVFGRSTCQRTKVNAWLCAPATERHLECFSAMKKVNAWICAPAIERDLQSFSAER